MTAVQEPPLTVEDWPTAHQHLVEQLCAVRPGLRTEQAHATLQGLLTLRWVLHPPAGPCPSATPVPSHAALTQAVEAGLRFTEADPDSVPTEIANAVLALLGQPNPAGAVRARCTATCPGLSGALLACHLIPHTDPWHDTGHGTQWRTADTGVFLMASPTHP